MGEMSRDLGKLNEETYWNQFKSISFMQCLDGDFHHQLAIPKKISDHLKEDLPHMVELNGPSGRKWDVGLLQSDETLFFKYGWQEFVIDHSLAENDILMFTYNREKCFRVMIIDPLTCCEKEASYFVIKSDSTRYDLACPGKRKEREFSLQSSSDEHALRSKEPSTSARGAKVNSATGTVLTPEVIPPSQYVSRRRPATKDKKKGALQLATADSFSKAMKPAQLSNFFTLGVPKEWWTKNLPYRTTKVYLRVKEREWHVTSYYHHYGPRGSKDVKFTTGWKQFALGNSLEENDECVFKRVSSMGDCRITGDCRIIIDVTINRAVQEAIPPTAIILHSDSRHEESSENARKRLHEESSESASKRLDEESSESARKRLHLQLDLNA